MQAYGGRNARPAYSLFIKCAACGFSYSTNFSGESDVRRSVFLYIVLLFWYAVSDTRAKATRDTLKGGKMLNINALTKTYSGNHSPSVDNLTLTVGEGEIYGFIGPNGAGKSTTIKCITGIVGFESGSVTVCGVNLKDDPLEAKKLIGYVSDDHILYEGLTGTEFVNFICDVFDVSSAEREERLERYLDLFDLRDAIGKQIKSYSHGMKQKLNIIGALIHEPKVWILDEPMTGLDPKSAYHLKNLMREHASKGNCVFFSSHVLDVVEKICDRVGIIDGGKLVADCTLAELRAGGLDNSLEELFLKITDAPIAAEGEAPDAEGGAPEMK